LIVCYSNTRGLCSDCSIGTKQDVNEEVLPHGNTNEQNGEKDIPIATSTEPTHQSKQVANVSATPIKTESTEIQAEQHITEDPPPNENHYQMIAASSDDDMASSASVSGLQSFGSELSQSETEEKSAFDRQHGSNSGHIITEKDPRVTLANGASAQEEKANSQNNNTKAINNSINAFQGGAVASTVVASSASLEVNPTERKMNMPVMVANGFRSTTPPDHPQNFPVDNVGFSEEKKHSEVVSGGCNPKDISSFPEEKGLPDGTANGFSHDEDETVFKTSPAVTVDPLSHHANYSTVSTDQTGLTGLNSHPHSQHREYYEGFATSGLPSNMTKLSGFIDLNAAPHSLPIEHGEGFSSASPNNRTGQSGLTGLRSTAQQQNKHFEGFSVSLPNKQTVTSSFTGLQSDSQQQHREHFQGGMSSLPSMSESRKSQGQKEEKPYSQETFKSTQDNCPTSTPRQSNNQETQYMFSSSSSAPPVSQEPSLSIMTASSAIASMPLYYQPHIVMKDNIPVLMLKPVLVPSLSGDVTSNQAMDLGANSMVFPLSSVQVKSL